MRDVTCVIWIDFFTLSCRGSSEEKCTGACEKDYTSLYCRRPSDKNIRIYIKKISGILFLDVLQSPTYACAGVKEGSRNPAKVLYANHLS